MTLPKEALGRLEQVSPRDVWVNEARDFTPWLAKEENITLLGESIGRKLKVETQEKDVGRFHADILCRDTDTDSLVLIENQLEPTDHCHLGQILTYAAGLKVTTVVWVAPKFDDQHRAALDWLNEITEDRFNFFGLEIELWRIGDSPPAPKFNVVCKPNIWTKIVQHEVEQLTGRKRLYLEYWTAFLKRLESQGLRLFAKPKADYALWFKLGKPKRYMTVQMWPKDRHVFVGMGTSDKDLWERVSAVKDQIDTEVRTEAGKPLHWEALDDTSGYAFAGLLLEEIDSADQNDWPNQHAWLQEKLQTLHRIFARWLEKLD